MIKRALLSVYDKTGIVEFASGLERLGIEIISTGGTYKLLKSNNIKVISAEEVTGFPEVLNGRVKTLHPNIFAGILADRNNPGHIRDLSAHNILPIDLVVVNLYPFKKTILKSDVTLQEAIEEIDIGGVTLIRAAAKNFSCVNVLTDPLQYPEHIKLLINGSDTFSGDYSRSLSVKAFYLTSDYDNSIGNYLSDLSSETDKSLKDIPLIVTGNREELRYGENPHQKGYLIKENFDEIFTVLHGKELSYNNLLDIDAAYTLISEFKDDDPACAIIKHGNPSGVAVSGDLQSAFSKAFATDTLSPFGGIIVINKKLDFKTSLDIDKLFTEIILAPDFDIEALEFLKKKKNRRLLKFNFAEEKNEFRKITGGVLLQEKDNMKLTESSLNFPTKKKASKEEISDMLFAFRIVKHVKSNAVVFVKDKKTLAVGGGQPSRIDSTKIAISKAKNFNLDLKGSVAASDAFFPFADGLIEIAKAGAICVIQPGGSVRDEEVVKAADDNNIAMAFTGIRHFKH